MLRKSCSITTASIHATIRNISTTGALVEGLWNVPCGTIFRIHLLRLRSPPAPRVGRDEDRMGVEFAAPLPRDANGGIVAMSAAPPHSRAFAA